MPNYLFAYHGGSGPMTEEEGKAAMAAWGAWFQELGDAVVDFGNPVRMSSTVSADGVTDNGGSNPVSGYGVFTASDQAAACEMAKGCPMVQNGSGSVEVAEIVVLEM